MNTHNLGVEDEWKGVAASCDLYGDKQDDEPLPLEF